MNYIHLINFFFRGQKKISFSMIKQISDSFQCWYCEKNLINNRYVIKNNFAICLNCFDEKYSNYCFQCNEIISIETQV